MWEVYNFNRVVGERVSIVEDTPGVTRDRVLFFRRMVNT